jgi:hypothetical protein
MQMSQENQTIEDREKELTARLQAMEKQMERLTARLGESEAAGVANPGATNADPLIDKEYPPENIADVSEEVLNWAGRTSLLPRLAALCFVLVVALILRTLVASKLVDELIGSVIGMSYAAILIIDGWHKYSKQSPLAPIMAACGAILMSAIVVETHSHFNSLPVVPAYLTLMITGISMALMSRQFNAFTPISVGIIAMCIAGALLDYPRPFFPYLSLVLLTANLLGYFASHLKRCTWLRWTALIVTILMLKLWQVQIVTTIRKAEAATPELAVDWFLPVIAVFAITYLGLALFGIIRRGSEKLSKYISSLPTINAIWAFFAATYVVAAQGGNTQLVGIIGSIMAFCHFGATFWLARRNIEGAPGSSSFTFAGGALLAVALPTATGSFALSLPVISIVAIVMALMSQNWGSGKLRFTTYLFQIYCCGALAFAFRGDSPAVMGVLNIVPAALLTGIMLYHYTWCRSNPPGESTSLIRRIDSKDMGAVVLLLAGLASGFFTLRIALFQSISMLPLEMHREAFRCSQSVLINCSAIALILFAFLKKNKEIRNVAILVMVVGGIKVFLYDLMGTHGLPLVFSVFSFGMAAAVESIALGKWQKQTVEQADI